MKLITENKAMAIVLLISALVGFFMYQAGYIRGNKEGTSITSKSCHDHFEPQLARAYACAPQCKPLTNDEIYEKCVEEAKATGNDIENCEE